MKSYKNIVIYYFTGTGNAEKVAYWISEIAAQMEVDAALVNIANIDRLHIDVPDPEALIIFISPVHGFNYPPVMLNFIWRFPRGKNDIALMNTRAGMLIGKFITPGITGVAFFLSALLLKLKGYDFRAMHPVDMPSNWISIHPGLNLNTIRYLHINNKEKVNVFAQRLISGKTSFKALREIVQDILCSPISLLYFCIGRFVFSKSFYASKDCNHCGICVKKCPVKAIIYVDKRPFWTFNCESCMRCMSNCPKKAIETGHGAMIGIIILNSSVLVGLFYTYFGKFFFDIKDTITGFILETSLFLISLMIWYRLIHYLMRFRFFERIMVFTSLTKYKFWGQRYKALSDKEFIK